MSALGYWLFSGENTRLGGPAAVCSLQRRACMAKTPRSGRQTAVCCDIPVMFWFPIGLFLMASGACGSKDPCAGTELCNPAISVVSGGESIKSLTADGACSLMSCGATNCGLHIQQTGSCRFTVVGVSGRTETHELLFGQQDLRAAPCCGLYPLQSLSVAVLQ